MKINLKFEYLDGDQTKILDFKEVPGDNFGIHSKNGDFHLEFSSPAFNIDIHDLDWVDLEPIQSLMNIYIWQLGPILDNRSYTLIGLGNNKEEALQSIATKAHREDSEHSLAEFDQIIRKLIARTEPQIVKSFILWSDRK